MSWVSDKYDTFEATDSALRAINKLFFLLHEQKPAKGSPEEQAWEAELKEVRRWAIDVHYRRIDICMRSKNARPLHLREDAGGASPG